MLEYGFIPPEIPFQFSSYMVWLFKDRCGECHVLNCLDHPFGEELAVVSGRDFEYQFNFSNGYCFLTTFSFFEGNQFIEHFPKNLVILCNLL